MTHILSPESIEKLDFKASVKKEHLRRLYPKLSDDLFEKKWQHASDHVWLFFRSFPRLWHASLSVIADQLETSFCVGDPHPDNFGFIQFENRVRYVVNDFDDAGFGPSVFDILRYLVALDLIGDTELVSSAATTFETGLGQQQTALNLSKDLFKDLGRKRRKLIKKFTDGKNRFRLNDSDLFELPSNEKTIWQETFQGLFSTFAHSGDYRVHDVVQRRKTSGGSAGQRRYYVLVEEKRSQKLDVIEFKLLANAAGARYRGANALEPKQRLEKAMKTFWLDDEPIHKYEYREISGQPFLMRSRTKASLKWHKLSLKEKTEVCKVQVGQLAEIHWRQGVRNIGEKQEFIEATKRLAEIWRQWHLSLFQ